MDHMLLAIDLLLLHDQHDQRNAKGLTKEERALWVKEVIAALRAAAAMLPTDSAAGMEAFDVAEFYERHKAHPPSREDRLKWATWAARVCLDCRKALEALGGHYSIHDIYGRRNLEMREGKRYATYKMGTVTWETPAPRVPAKWEKSDPRSGWKGRK